MRKTFSPAGELVARVSHQNILNNDIHPTYSGGCSMGFWLGSFRAWPAGLASASSVVNSSRVISILPCGMAEK